MTPESLLALILFLRRETPSLDAEAMRGRQGWGGASPEEQARKWSELSRWAREGAIDAAQINAMSHTALAEALIRAEVRISGLERRVRVLERKRTKQRKRRRPRRRR